jgi:psiF repeat
MEMTMRFSTVAAAVCLCLLPMAGAFTAAPPAPRADIPGTTVPGAAAPGAATPATAAPPAAKTAPTPSSAPPSGDAAAKHAKRTACLKDAKTKKLVGADKTAFLKSCIAAQ